MSSASPGCDSSSPWYPKTRVPKVNSAVIYGWLADQPHLSPEARPLKRRRPLQPTHTNMNRPSPRKKNSTEQQSPARKARRTEKEVLSDEGYVEENAISEDDATTPKPERRGRQLQPTQPPLDVAAFSAIGVPDNTTPSRSYTNALARHLVLHPSNTGSSTSSTQSGKSKSRRTTSPAKNYSDLRLLNKPVKYGFMDAEQDDLPEDIRTLTEDLQALCDNTGIIPSRIQDRIPGAKKRPHWMYETGRDELDVLIELDMMKRVQAAAVSLSTAGGHEPQWYCSVQWPLLDTAFRDQSHMEPKQISHALPIKECLPRTGDQYSESRLVDFAINLVPQSISIDALSEWLRNQPSSLRTVNQSLYPPLCRHPTVISIEVKTNGTEEEARVQIGIWLSAWHERVGQLYANERHRVITLPVIIVLNHYWHLYFAIDRGSHIEILQFAESIGDTISLIKMYRILAILRRLGKWGLEIFEPWFNNVICDGMRTENTSGEP